MQPAAGIQLRWKSYLKDLRVLLQQLRRSEELTDVVLTNGSASVRCHSIVLSAACQTFHDLLKEHTGDVVICLGGVDSSDLRSLVDYMYSGEVEVAPGRLGDFLALAAQWGVRGLEETARSARQQTEVSDAQGSTFERTATEGLPLMIEINSSAESPGHGSQRNASLTADSTSRRRGRSQSTDSDSSSDEESGRAPVPATSNSVLSAIHPNAERKSKKRPTPCPSSSLVEPQAGSAQDSANNTNKSPKVSKRTKSRKTARASIPNMFACPHCPRVFVKPSYFETHLKKHHNDRTLPEKHRVKMSNGTKRVVEVAGGLLMNLPSVRAKKRKPAQPEERRKKRAEERAAEAVAVADAADAAVRAALERAANRPGAGLSEATLLSASASQVMARDVTGGPPKRRGVARREKSSSSSSDSDSDSSVEVTRAGGGKTASVPVAASTPGRVAAPARPPPAPAPPPPPPPPPPPADAPEPPEDFKPIIISIESEMHPTTQGRAKSNTAAAPPPVGIASHVRRESTDRDDPRSGQDRDRDRHPAAHRSWQRHGDRDRDRDRELANGRDGGHGRDRPWNREPEPSRQAPWLAPRRDWWPEGPRHGERARGRGRGLWGPRSW